MKTFAVKTKRLKARSSKMPKTKKIEESSDSDSGPEDVSNMCLNNYMESC